MCDNLRCLRAWADTKKFFFWGLLPHFHFFFLIKKKELKKKLFWAKRSAPTLSLSLSSLSLVIFPLCSLPGFFFLLISKNNQKLCGRWFGFFSFLGAEKKIKKKKNLALWFAFFGFQSFVVHENTISRLLIIQHPISCFFFICLFYFFKSRLVIFNLALYIWHTPHSSCSLKKKNLLHVQGGRAHARSCEVCAHYQGIYPPFFFNEH